MTEPRKPVGLPLESRRHEPGEPAPDWVQILQESREERSEELLAVWREQRERGSTPHPGVSE
jgi:hypothetical protein